MRGASSFPKFLSDRPFNVCDPVTGIRTVYVGMGIFPFDFKHQRHVALFSQCESSGALWVPYDTLPVPPKTPQVSENRKAACECIISAKKRSLCNFFPFAHLKVVDWQRDYSLDSRHRNYGRTRGCCCGGSSFDFLGGLRVEIPAEAHESLHIVPNPG